MSLVLKWHNNINKYKIFNHQTFLESGGNFQTSEEIGVEVASSTPVERNKFFSIFSTPKVEHLYTKILLRNGVEQSSGVEVDPYTRYKTDVAEAIGRQQFFNRATGRELAARILLTSHT